MKQFNQLSPQAQTTIIQTLLSLYSGDLPQHVKDEIAEWKIYSTSKQPEYIKYEDWLATVQPQQTTEEITCDIQVGPSWAVAAANAMEYMRAENQSHAVTPMGMVKLPDGSYGYKIRNHWGSKEVSQPQQVTSEPSKPVWPLGVNQSMDHHLVYNGFPHWSCTSKDSNEHFQRIDGRRYSAKFDLAGGYPDELKRVDKDYPISVAKLMECCLQHTIDYSVLKGQHSASTH